MKIIYVFVYIKGFLFFLFSLYFSDPIIVKKKKRKSVAKKKKKERSQPRQASDLLPPLHTLNSFSIRLLKLIQDYVNKELSIDVIRIKQSGI